MLSFIIFTLTLDKHTLLQQFCSVVCNGILLTLISRSTGTIFFLLAKILLIKSYDRRTIHFLAIQFS